jgi:hypothetical protein
LIFVTFNSSIHWFVFFFWNCHNFCYSWAMLPYRIPVKKNYCVFTFWNIQHSYHFTENSSNNRWLNSRFSTHVLPQLMKTDYPLFLQNKIINILFIDWNCNWKKLKYIHKISENTNLFVVYFLINAMIFTSHCWISCWLLY